MKRFRFLFFLLTLFSFCMELADSSTSFVRTHAYERVQIVDSDADAGGNDHSFPVLKKASNNGSKASKPTALGKVSHSADEVAFVIWLTHEVHVGTVTPEIESFESIHLRSITHPPEHA